MRKHFYCLTVAGLFLSMSLYNPPLYAKKLYRWVDENGKTYLSDQVPPEHARYRRESLNKKGVVLEVTEQAKTKKQLALEKRLEQLNMAREQIIARQKDSDRVLLSTYRSVDDMDLALENKMRAFDIKVKLLRKQLKASEDDMARNLKTAADRERNGEKVVNALKKKVIEDKKQIESLKEQINTLSAQKEIARDAFAADIERYRFLTQVNAEGALKLSAQTAEILASDTLGVYQCPDKSLCDKAWKIARQFIKANSTMPITTENSDLIMAAEPSHDTDVSLSVALVRAEPRKEHIFLDVLCRSSDLGDALCASPRLSELRKTFRGYIESRLNGEQALSD